MKFTFLGTSAANAYPEAFCRCDNCARARLLGGPSLRARSSALVNDDLLLDLGPDIMTAAMRHDITLTGVRYCLQSHAHADHFDASHLLSRSPGYGVVGAPRLQLYASSSTLQVAARLLARDTAPGSLFDEQVGEALNFSVHPVAPLQPFQVGSYEAIAFPAAHDPQVEPYLYAIRSGYAVGDGTRCLFYGTDTADLPEATWAGFHRFNLRFHLVILDHTYGPGQPTSDHLSAFGVIGALERMRAEGLLAPGGRAFATHIAHEGNPPHPELSDFAAQHGYEIACDGLQIVI